MQRFVVCVNQLNRRSFTCLSSKMNVAIRIGTTTMQLMIGMMIDTVEAVG